MTSAIRQIPLDTSTQHHSDGFHQMEIGLTEGGLPVRRTTIFHPRRPTAEDSNSSGTATQAGGPNHLLCSVTARTLTINTAATEDNRAPFPLGIERT
jgi:hypothetical protein